MQIAILLYDRLTALDAIGPYEVFNHLPDATVTFVATEAGPVRSDSGRLGLVADATLDEVPHPEVVLVPGGPGQAELMEDGPVHSWLRSVHDSSVWTTSVCTGSLILGAAGLLKGVRATTYWLAMDQLDSLGAVPTPERFVVDGKIVTAAGVSAGIDMALALTALIAGDSVAQAVQLGIEYDPQPPFGAGSPESAPPAVVELLSARSRFSAVPAQPS